MALGLGLSGHVLVVRAWRGGLAQRLLLLCATKGLALLGVTTDLGTATPLLCLSAAALVYNFYSLAFAINSVSTINSRPQLIPT